MNFIESIRGKAKNRSRTIVLPEGNEDRMIKAAAIISKEKLAKLILIGREDEIKNKAKKFNVDLSDIEIKLPEIDSNFSDYVDVYYEIRKNKGVDQEDANRIMQDPLFYGAALAKK